MTNIANGQTLPDTLTGQYTRDGSKLTGPCTLLLVHRGTTTTAKAHTFALLVHPDGRRTYVSSVWDGPSAGTYAMEYRGGPVRHHPNGHHRQCDPIGERQLTENGHVHQ